MAIGVVGPRVPSSRQEFDVQVCESCGRFGRLGEETCCGERTTSVETTVICDQPELPSVVSEVFGLSATDLAVCYALDQLDEATVDELTNHFDRDRSTVSRSLDRLGELDLVEKRPRIPESGGRVHVYSSRPLDDVRRRLELGLYAWVDAAVEEVDELDRRKMETMADRETDPVSGSASRDAADGPTDETSTTEDAADAMASDADEETERSVDEEAERSLLDRILEGPRS